MESNEEPQKKVFKARKTMRASDRQQLESVYKVKEEFLKTNDKLLNGKHENGDSDLSSPLINSDCPEEKELNGIEDVCRDAEEVQIDSEEITDAQSADIKENQPNDLAPKLETMSPENIASEQDHEDAHSTSGPDSESQMIDCHRDNDLQGEVNIKDDLNCEDICIKDNLDQKATPNQPDDENKVSCEIYESSTVEEPDELSLTPALPMEEEKSVEEAVEKDGIGEEAISSSMDTDKDAKDENVQSADLLETSSQKALEDEPVESVLGNADTMETDEIIPILEKLAPAEDALNCFSKSVLLPVENPNLDAGDKVEDNEFSIQSSPSKHESNESLPKEAFLVLSDEEELCCDKETEASIPIHASPSEGVEIEKEADKVEEKGPDKEDDDNEEKPPEKSEASRRKRSKSEDMDSVHSKRRRCVEEDYEAEFEVKITTRGDVNRKLEKVIQRFLEEKFSALQCAVFEKNLADLKTRVDKIECGKRHKTVLTELQNLQNTPHSPGKAMSDTGSINNVAYRVCYHSYDSSDTSQWTFQATGSSHLCTFDFWFFDDLSTSYSKHRNSSWH
ncbi:hypothetical protein lerEdw1_003816 [Lerista edwardsae]|nr:hypothetical protein lerEdw1_003816 [Lerista edwardsae]